jgi:hypothetical protein
MAEVEFPQRLRLPRDLDRRPTPADFRPGAARRVRRDEIDAPASPAMNEVVMQNHRPAVIDMEAPLNVRKLQQQPTRNPLDEIATLVQGLTYGEMIELSEAIWKVQAAGMAVTQENLPALLHRWSTSRVANTNDTLEEMPRNEGQVGHWSP